MAAIVLEPPSSTSEPGEQSELRRTVRSPRRWLIFHYTPAALFSLKNSRATSTAGKTLLTPTPYAVKMAFLDAALRHALTDNPERLVRWLAEVSLRIGVPPHACVTGTIQSVRQEMRDTERKREPEGPAYRSSIAMREFVHYQGTLRLAFDLKGGPPEFIALLILTAPAINYLGKRGSFVQYLGSTRRASLDATFTQLADDTNLPAWGQRTALDDFGAKASFAALNSFTSKPMRRDVDRKFVETIVPFNIYNSGPGFVHYSAPNGQDFGDGPEGS
jgi:hypothetical protein